MYFMQKYVSAITSDDGFILLAETIYRQHPTVKSIQVWSKSEHDESGNHDVYYLFRICYLDDYQVSVSWKNIWGSYCQDRISVSYNGRILFIQDYLKGVYLLDIATSRIICHYNVKHVYSIWATDTSLTYIHKEVKRTISRINLDTGIVEERKKASGDQIVPLSKCCVLYKKSRTHFVLANSENLSECVECRIADLIGFQDDNFHISHAAFKSGGIFAQCSMTDADDHSRIIHKEMFLHCPEIVFRFLESLDGNYYKEGNNLSS